MPVELAVCPSTFSFSAVPGKKRRGKGGGGGGRTEKKRGSGASLSPPFLSL